ncbi:uncharacterized protein CANTADRAFT_54060 [Suhomyces tanzawaensis NRRL Y-17324]|uniref:Mitochondrial group I intron splicing factor CCM1 n=1 Tax=Suhomyces tanzawaensis NRRL Y-17324 TaxID=984487 RepID=A0A1E4SEE2_9ASCO|nr:uncharacterized protein CANTADRAFT_54060 [Suhomyces tanzawaensis NRRL Y-17324]ODV77853.1 hypothetical protein CANTADRAFT_54060 [Suhomyces tanzawaensis NRRL Y-17324]
MNSIRDTISRIGRSARQIKSFTNNHVSASKVKPLTKDQSSKIINRPNSKHIEDPQQYLHKYQTKLYRDFLEPLGIPNLKIFNDDLPKYDDDTAILNWTRKSNSKQINVFLLQDRMLFEKMMDTLILLTPSKLRGANKDNALSKNHLLHQQEHESSRMQSSWPTDYYEEVPPIPQPLTKQSFQEYIYVLTHTRFHYKNSLSLSSGIIAEILLYTHKLTNEEFRPYRSVHTYNYLIKYFGFDKHQSSFARELLLVMNKDGHKPNIDTINNLLKLCQIHSRIRSNTNTYQIIMKYLKLCRDLNIEINLSTYNRVYDAINNIFLREIFLTKIQLIDLLILKNLIIKILDDFASTTKDTTELIKFINTDLNQKAWHDDSKLLNKVIYHRGLNLRPLNNLQDNGELEKLWLFVGASNLAIDQYTLKALIESIRKNNHITHNKPYLMLSIYFNLVPKIQGPVDSPRIYKDMIEEMITSADLKCSAFMIKGMIHEATMALKLPREITHYDNEKQSMPENYKIIRRIVGDRMDVIEAKIEYSNKYSSKIAPLHTEMTQQEKIKWDEMKAMLAIRPTHRLLAIPPQEILDFLGDPEEVEVPTDYILRYKKIQRKKYQGARIKARENKITEGIDKHTRNHMIERSILARAL